MTTLSEEVAEVVRGLTKAQRYGIAQASPFGLGAWLLPVGYARGLTGLGVVVRTIDGMCLTPLGLAVRTHLTALAGGE